MRTKNEARITPAESEHMAWVKSCSEEGCLRPVTARGMCHTHYMRARRSGRNVKSIETTADYIQSRIAVTAQGCWEWQLTKWNGYGRLSRMGRTWPAHVFSYQAHVGPIPVGLQINHKCHNRACVNPEHLYAGTQAENVADMLEAGRANPVAGEQNGNCKVTPDVVRAVRQSSAIARIEAQKHGISISLVYAIRKRLVWRDLTDA